ncbi:MAG: murein hydrolase activator EnvC [Acidiferrobacterales bacterium]
MKLPVKNIIFSISILLLPGQFLPIYAASDQENQAKLEQVKKQIQALQKKLEGTRGQRDDEQVALRQTEKEIGSTLRAIKNTGQKLKREQRQMNRLQQKKSRQQSSLTQYQSRLAQQAQATYVMGRQEYLKLLLNQQDPARVSRMLVYYRYINQARLKQIRQVQSAVEEINQTSADIRQRQQQLVTLRDQRAIKKETLEKTRANRKQILAKLNRKVQFQSKTLSDLNQDRQRLQDLLQGLQDYFSELPELPDLKARFGKSRGKMKIPVRGSLLARYGAPRNLGDLRWKGLFIRSKTGADVRVIFRGRVAYADWLRGFGLLLIIDHGDGYMSLYGHNSSLYKEVGDWVETGQVIASTGNTGNPPTPGLYFEIRQNGRPRDPLIWVRRG